LTVILLMILILTCILCGSLILASLLARFLELNLAEW